ncbi:MAG: O-antigen ligase family protein, partial [Nitrososphaerales archaeon]
VALLPQVAVLGLGLVRSIWVAVPAAILATMAVVGATTRFKVQFIRFLMIVAVMAVAVVALRPSVVNRLGAQADSIISYSGGTTSSDNNAKWRLSNWRYGLSEIEKHPIFGVGFGQSEVPPAICTTGCNVPVQNDPTVLPGADLHNSILAIPLRLGLPALALFLIFEGMIIARARRLGRRSGTMQWLLACHLVTAFTALTTVVLEGPYMGVFFWLFGGLVLGFTPRASPGKSGVRGTPDEGDELLPAT